MLNVLLLFSSLVLFCILLSIIDGWYSLSLESNLRVYFLPSIIKSVKIRRNAWKTNVQGTGSTVEFAMKKRRKD